MGRGSSRTLQHWLDKGYKGEDAEKMRLSRTPGTLEYFTIFKGMSAEDAIDAKEEYHNKRKNTYENFIKRHGEIEGEIKWQIYKDRQAYSNSYEYKHDKYGWTLDEWLQFNSSRGNSGFPKTISELNYDKYRKTFEYRKEEYGWTEEMWELYVKSPNKNAGIFNPNYGTSYYQRWVDKYGKKKADEMNDEVTQKKINVGSKNGNYGRTFPVETIDKMKESAIKRVIRQGTCVAYNKSSIPIIERYGKDNGYNFQHAENGGEFQVPGTTYFVDGYDKEKNVVLEYDEQYHMSTSQQIKDLERQQQIIKVLGCTFIRIDNKNKVTIYED